MRILAVGIMLIPLLTFIKIYNRKCLMCPMNVFTLLYFFKIMIPTVLYADLEFASEISVDYVKSAVMVDSNYFIYCTIQTLGYFMAIFGMRLVFNKSNRMSIQKTHKVRNYKGRNHYLIWGLICTTIGLVVFFLLMQKAGGVLYFYTHLQYRTTILRNEDLLSWLLIFLHYGPLLIVYSMRGKSREINLCLIAMILVCGFMCGLGGRKAVIVMLLEMLFIYHFTVKQIRIKQFLKLRYIILLGVVLIYFTVMVQFRAEGMMEQFLNNPLEFMMNQSSDGLSIFRKESYVAYYMAIIQYFKTHEFWMGSSFLGLLTAFIPSSLFPGKPPVDDGMYLYSICLGREDIMPIMPTNQLNTSSFPLETFGSMYANFGFIGVLVGMLILGVLINSIYKRMVKNGYQFVDIIIYCQVLLSLEMSTLRLFQIIEVFIMLEIIMFFINKIRIKVGGES